MDLVRLSITGGLALASVLTLLSTARPGNADPQAPGAASAPVIVSDTTALSSPIVIGPAAQTPLVRLSSDQPFLLPATSGSARAPTFDERWRGGPTVWNAYIEEASRRFGVPVSWIRSVMQAESAGQQYLNGLPITSPKGAMGLMQVMPATYAELRARYGLGPDPYDPRDNVLAGTAYIREMYDRFGAPGFVAAYNAGPSRVAEWLARGRQLPDETRRYVAEVAPRVGDASSDLPRASIVRVAGPVQDLTGPALLSGRTPAPVRAPLSPAEAPLFVGAKARASTNREQAETPPSDGLFVALGSNDRRRASTADDTKGN